MDEKTTKNKIEESNLRIGMDAADIPQPERMLAFFKFEHLPPNLRGVSQPFCQLAEWVVSSQPQTPERTVCLRKLLEAKDCAVRNML